jgi:hypothetical protein
MVLLCIHIGCEHVCNQVCVYNRILISRAVVWSCVFCTAVADVVCALVRDASHTAYCLVIVSEATHGKSCDELCEHTSCTTQALLLYSATHTLTAVSSAISVPPTRKGAQDHGVYYSVAIVTAAANYPADNANNGTAVALLDVQYSYDCVLALTSVVQ